MERTTSEVLDILHDTLDVVEAEESELAGGVRAVIPDDEVGSAMGALRRNFDNEEWQSKRDPSGENLIVNIEAEQKRQSIRELFR